MKMVPPQFDSENLPALILSWACHLLNGEGELIYHCCFTFANIDRKNNLVTFSNAFLMTVLVKSLGKVNGLHWNLRQT